MDIAVIGFAREGKTSFDYFSNLGHRVTICDRNADLEVPEGASAQLGAGYLAGLDRFDLIIRTAGMPRSVILEKNPGVGAKITTATNEFLRACPTNNVIGVSGTKGKGTTCTLIAKMLEVAGKKVFLGGNIGNSPLEFIADITSNDWVVLELSSFQLSDIERSPRIAACLMVVPEHLNWHDNMDDYITAKANLFKHQKPEDLAIFFADNDNSRAVVEPSPGKKIPYFARPGAIVNNNNEIEIDGNVICKSTELKLLGKHNLQNVCAATTVVWNSLTEDKIRCIRQVLTSFSGLEHRLEFVRDLDNTKYYDDSFGTTPETAIVAIEAFEQPKVIILGGSDKGSDFTELAKAIANDNVHHVILIGDTAPKIEAALRAENFTSITTGLNEMASIVTTAQKLSLPGDVVLLSTACASFGLFKDYKDRGEQFQQAVNSLR